MSDQGYGGPRPWDEPVGDPQCRAEPLRAAAPVRLADAPPTRAPPPPSHSGQTLALVLAAIAVVAALGIGGFVLLSDDGPTNPAAGRTGAAPSARSLPVAPIPLPTITLPSIALPTFPSLPGGGASGPGLINPCGFASSPLQVATIYVGLAEIGQGSTAQGCVYRDTVPSAVTAGLATAGGGAGRLFVPGRVDGSVVGFTTADGSTRLEVTVTREPDGKLYVTKVDTK